MRRLLSASSLLAFAAACNGTDSTMLLSEDSAPNETISVAQFALKSSLPTCNKSTVGSVFYVVKDEELVYCDGKAYQDVEFPCDPTWLVSASAATSCPYGGSTLSAGPDNNGNGKLDKKEVVSSASACNGAPGATGPQGPTGPAGANGATGASGPQGPAGANGADGTSCSVQDNGDGTILVTCTDGTTAIVSNGQDGATGLQGPAGATGATGPQGPQGIPGQSCSLASNGPPSPTNPAPAVLVICPNSGAIPLLGCAGRNNADGSFSVFCNNGTNVTIHDGATGPQGPAGPAGADGTNGTDGSSCTTKDNGDGTYTMSCTDGTSVTWHDGATGPQGPAGSSCSVHDNGNHTYEVTCPDASHVTISDGQDGEDATLGALLINTIPEPKGVHCHNAGNLVQVGVDTNNSGQLDPDEVTGSDYACAPLAEIAGNIEIFTNADVEQLRGVGSVLGYVRLSGNFTDVIALHGVSADLSSIQSLYVQNTPLTSLDVAYALPGLTDVTRDVDIYGNPALTSVNFPQLDNVRNLSIGSNALLASLSFPQLTTTNQLIIYNNAGLTSLSFPQLTTAVSNLSVYNNAGLTSLSFPQLTTVGTYFYVYNNALLPSCKVVNLENQLTSVPAFVNISGNSASCPP